MGTFALARMAWRNLWRNRRRTLITLSSIAFATMLAVLFTGLQDHSWTQVINLAARLGGGHVTIQHPDYLDKPATSRTVRGLDALSAEALRDPRVRAVMPRIVGQVMLATAAESLGAGFIAFDPSRESPATLSVLEAVREGSVFGPGDSKGLLIGARLAENLGVKLRSKVVYTLTDKQGEIVSGLARVSGIVRTGSPSVDQGLCLLPIDSVRKALGYQADEAVQLAVFVRDQRDSEAVAADLGSRLGEGAAALTWKQSQPDLDSLIAMKKGGTLFFELLILVLCAAGIFNTMFVSVMERLREFGILLAIGLSPGRLFALIMWESLWLALLGLVAGAVVTAWPYHHMNVVGIDMSVMVGEGGMDISGVAMEPVMRVGIYGGNLAAICLVAVIATLLAGVYPAWRAGRVEPVETIKLV